MTGLSVAAANRAGPSTSGRSHVRMHASLLFAALYGGCALAAVAAQDVDCGGACVARYEQCRDGSGFRPCCSSEDKCYVKSDFYAQCRPKNGPKPPWKSGYMATCPTSQAPEPAPAGGRKGKAGATSNKGYYEADPDDPVCLGACASTWKQCGGARGVFEKAFKRCCDPADHCVRKNGFYSQCRPASQPLPAWWPGARVIDCSTRSSSPVPQPRPGEVEEPEDPMAPEDTDGVAEPPEDAQPESGQDTPGGPPDDGSGVPLPPDPSQPAPGKDAPSETGFPVPELEEPDPGVEIMPPDSAPSESPSDPESPAPPEPAPPDAEPPAQPDAPPGDAPGEAGGTPPVEPGQQAPSIPGSEPSDPGSEDDTETPTGDSQPPLPGQQTPDGPEDTPDAPGTLEPGQPPDPVDPPEPVDPAQPVEPPQVTPDEAAPEPAPPPMQAIAPEPTPGVVGGAAPPQATADDPFVAVAPPGEAAPRTGSDEFVPRPQAPLTERPPDTTASDQFVPRPPEAPIGMVPQRAQTEQ